MVPALSENKRSARGRKKTSHPFLSEALGKSLRAMAGKHSGLVHQPPGLVGTSDTSLVSENGNRKTETGNGKHLRRHRTARRFRELGARSGHARHVVLVLVVGV